MVNQWVFWEITLIFLNQYHVLKADPSLSICSSPVKHKTCILHCNDPTLSGPVTFEHNRVLQGSCPFPSSCTSTNYYINQTLPDTYLIISSLDKLRDEGQWQCFHGVTNSPNQTLSVPSPLGTQKTPQVMITGFELTVTCEMSCQYPTKAITVEVIYAEAGSNNYGPFSSAPTVVTYFTDKTGCDSYESNYKAVFTLTKSNDLNSLLNKKLAFKCNFTHSMIQESTGNTGPASALVEIKFQGSTTELTFPVTTEQNGSCTCPALFCVGDSGFCILWIILIAAGVIVVFAVCILCVICAKRKKKNKKDNRFKMTKK